MLTVQTTIKHFYQEAVFYIGVAVPFIGLLVDMVNNEIKTGNAVSAPYTVLLTKIVAGLTGVYVVAKKYESAQVNQAPPPAPVVGASGVQG